MNRFIDLISQQRIKTKDELKRTFRELVKKAHPDTGFLGDNGEVFKQIMREYREATECFDDYAPRIEKAKESERIYDRTSMLESFCFLITRCFPLNKREMEQNGGYVQDYREMAAQLKSLERDRLNLFLDFEKIALKHKEANRLRTGYDAVHANIQSILYMISSYYYTRNPIYLNGIEHSLGVVNANASFSGKNTVQGFVEFILSEIEQCPVEV